MLRYVALRRLRTLPLYAAISTILPCSYSAHTAANVCGGFSLWRQASRAHDSMRRTTLMVVDVTLYFHVRGVQSRRRTTLWVARLYAAHDTMEASRNTCSCVSVNHSDTPTTRTRIYT